VNTVVTEFAAITKAPVHPWMAMTGAASFVKAVGKARIKDGEVERVFVKHGNH